MPAIPPIGGAGLAMAVMSLFAMQSLAQGAAPLAKPLKGPGSLDGVWIITGYKGSSGYTSRDRALHTSDGKMPPLLPEPARLLEQRIADGDRGDPYPSTLSRCLPAGVPQMMFGAPYPIQIVERPGQVLILFEEQNHFRSIRLNGRHPKDPDPTFMGDQVGHWETGTFVVDTIGLVDRTTLDPVGMPHSEDLHVIERYRRVDAQTLEIRVQIEDPKTFSRPWEARVDYKAAPAGSRVKEYICENNLNGPDSSGHMGFGTQSEH
jgi:hypothetical protein